MKNNSLENNFNPERVDKSGKAPYSSPVLRVFGSVSTLTRGGLGSKCDNANSIGDQNSSCKNLSDRSAKENVARVGTHPLGFGLYLFDYKPQFRQTCGRGRQFGVMADEVETIMPEAVSVDPNGFKQVNYAMLGISHNIR